jgi:proteasome component ECM29
MKLEIQEEALKGLEFPESGEVPSLEAIISVFDKNTRNPYLGVVKTPGLRWVDNVSVDTLVVALSFFRQVLLRSISPSAELMPLVSLMDEKIQWVSHRTRIELMSGLKTLWNSKGVTGLLKWVDKALSSPEASTSYFKLGGLLQSISSFILLELLSLGPFELSKLYIPKIEWIIGFIASPKAETRISMAHILGLVATFDLEHDTTGKFGVMLQSLIASAAANEKNMQDKKHGSLLASAFLISRVMYRYPKSRSKYISDEIFLKAMENVLEGLESQQTELMIASCLSMAEMARYGPVLAVTEKDSIFSKIQTKLQGLLKSSKELKVQEAAAFAIGHQTVGNPGLINDTLEFIYTLPNILSKQAELHFNVGEAICACLMGFSSSHMEEYLDISDIKIDGSLFKPVKENEVNSALKKLLSFVTPAQSAVMKKAACIWLLCLTKYCGKVSVVSSHLLSFHDAFSSLLGDKDEFTQEIASKGIGLIYDIGDKALKDQLVQALVSTFTEGKKIAAQSVNNTTELFAQDALGSTPDGGSINTYQSILSLAADMNQPDLVYKFMSLASHHAVWNSRRGASMGFGSIAAQAEQELLPHLPKIVPKLYRYRFDPHPKTGKEVN